MSYFVEDQAEENERFAETIRTLRRQVTEVRADRDRIVAASDHLMDRLRAERDEARAEVVRLGRENEEHIRTIRSLNAHREADV